jgi:alpha-beta hydrolase superfamily lysophospholipase
MLTNNGQYLLGSFFRHTSENYRGVVLFCHELNGNRYGVSPYLDSILSAGFDLLTFDFRGHGDSQHGNVNQITPRVTVDNMEDVQTAIDWLRSRFGETCNINLFGMGKGATIALCAAAAFIGLNTDTTCFATA